MQKYFRKRSASNIWYKFVFYHLVGTALQRVTAAPRFLAIEFVRAARHARKALVAKSKWITDRVWRRFPQASAKYDRFVAERSLRKAVRNSSQLRIVFGSSGTGWEGWISAEYPMVDVTSHENLTKYFRPNSVEAMLAEHVWEYLDEALATAAFHNCYMLLAPRGYLRLAVPDGFHPDKDYIEYVKPGGWGPGSDDHKVLYNYKTLTDALTHAGLEVELLEWFDEEGKFHAVEWAPEDGYVSRSTRFDDRNKDNPAAYTSLIVDAFKPKERT